MLFVDRKTRSVVANQADPEDILTKSANVFVGTLPAKVNIANTAIDWAGVKWTMIIFPPPVEDEMIGPSEPHGSRATCGIASRKTSVFPVLVRQTIISIRATGGCRCTWRARTFAAALTGQGKQRRQALTHALLFRAYRRMIFPKLMVRKAKWRCTKGWRKYTGVRLSGSPHLNLYVVGLRP